MRLNMRRLAQSVALSGAALVAISSRLGVHDVSAQGNRYVPGKVITIGGTFSCDCTNHTEESCFCIVS